MEKRYLIKYLKRKKVRLCYGMEIYPISIVFDEEGVILDMIHLREIQTITYGQWNEK